EAGHQLFQAGPGRGGERPADVLQIMEVQIGRAALDLAVFQTWRKLDRRSGAPFGPTKTRPGAVGS
ncbi:MAG: hypothetical protein J2P33_13465, partial [Actinobacteria bacterium]|nr:hypothetical protein [Actinomycetota bacterium]